jgi:mRNA interferase MazF
MSIFVKRFIEWIMCKIYLDRKDHKPPFFKEGEIWWCYMGENIGCEISGKGNSFKRPVLIIKKLDKYSFIALPVTRTIRNGSWYYHFYNKGVSNNIILVQPRYLDYRRLDKPLTSIFNDELMKVRSNFISMFK